MSDSPQSPRDVAEAVDVILRRSNARDFFRERVLSAAAEQRDIEDGLNSRQCARRKELIHRGTWAEHQPQPQPDGEESILHREVFTVATHLPVSGQPAGASAGERKKWINEMHLHFVELQKAGFPDNRCQEGAVKEELHCYGFEVEVLLPANLDPRDDPPVDGPLPVPGRKVSLLAKYAALAAVYDAHWPGAEKIAPWGVHTCGDEDEEGGGVVEEVVNWMPGDRDSARSANWYFHQVLRAEEIDADNASVVGSWLADVESDLARRFAESTTVSTTESEGEASVQLASQLKLLLAGDKPPKFKAVSGDDKVSYTQTKLDRAIEDYKNEHSEAFRAWTRTMEKGNEKATKKARDDARKVFGRNAIARNLSVRSPAMITKSQVYIGIADALGITSPDRGKLAAIGGKKIGLDIALEHQAEASGNPVVEQLEREETTGSVTERLNNENDPKLQDFLKSILDGLESGTYSSDRAEELLELCDQQRQDEQSKHVLDE